MAGSDQVAMMDGSGTLSGRRRVYSDELDAGLSLPATTMFVVASSGALWVLIYQAVLTLFG